MDRPKEIARFEALGLAASLSNVAATVLARHVVATTIAGAAVGAALSVGLILWTSRGRSGFGRPLTTGWLGLGIVTGLISLVWLAARAIPLSPSLALGLGAAAIVLNIAAVALLWSRAASAWLAR